MVQICIAKQTPPQELLVFAGHCCEDQKAAPNGWGSPMHIDGEDRDLQMSGMGVCEGRIEKFSCRFFFWAFSHLRKCCNTSLES